MSKWWTLTPEAVVQVALEYVKSVTEKMERIQILPEVGCEMNKVQTQKEGVDGFIARAVGWQLKDCYSEGLLCEIMVCKV